MQSDTTKRRRGGMVPYEPTPKDRAQIVHMVGYGLTYRQMAVLMRNPRTGKPISVNTLQKVFAEELEMGKAYAHNAVVGNLFKRATADHPSAVNAAIWWTKARLGWKSTDRFEHHHEGATTGVMLAPASRSPSDWIADQKKKNTKRKAPTSRKVG